MRPTSSSAPATVTDPHQQTPTYLYDALRGFRIRGETDQLGKTTWYEYDQGGFVSKVIDKNDIKSSSDTDYVRVIR
jgi:YD repeat-containing protein